MGHVSNYSEQTASEIDEEIQTIISTAYDKTEQILKEHIDELHRLAGVLYEKGKSWMEANSSRLWTAACCRAARRPPASWGQALPGAQQTCPSGEEGGVPQPEVPRSIGPEGPSDGGK